MKGKIKNKGRNSKIIIHSILGDVSTSLPEGTLTEEATTEDIYSMRDDLSSLINGHTTLVDTVYSSKRIELSDDGSSILVYGDDFILLLLISSISDDDTYDISMVTKDIYYLLDGEDIIDNLDLSDCMAINSESSIILRSTIDKVDLYKIDISFKDDERVEESVDEDIGLKEDIMMSTLTEETNPDILPYFNEIISVLSGSPVSSTTLLSGCTYASINRTQDDLSRYGISVSDKDTDDTLFNIDISTYNDAGTSKSDLERDILDILRNDADQSDTVLDDCTINVIGDRYSFYLDLYDGSEFLLEVVR